MDGLNESESTDLLLANQIQHIYSLIQVPALINMVVDQQGCRDLFSHILNSIVRSMDAPGQTLYFQTIAKENNDEMIPRTPLVAILYQCVICNAKMGVKIEKFSSPTFVIEFISSLLLSSAQHAHRSIVIDVVSTIVGTLVNKNLSGADCLQFLKTVQLEFVEKVIMNPESPMNQRIDVLVVYAWIAKGLMAKADSKGLELVSFLISLLNEEGELAATASRGIELVIKDDARGYLTKKSFGVQRLLFKQRLYNYAAPLLVKGFEGALSGMLIISPHTKSNSWCILFSQQKQLLDGSIPSFAQRFEKDFDE